MYWVDDGYSAEYEGGRAAVPVIIACDEMDVSAISD